MSEEVNVLPSSAAVEMRLVEAEGEASVVGMVMVGRDVELHLMKYWNEEVVRYCRPIIFHGVNDKIVTSST